MDDVERDDQGAHPAIRSSPQQSGRLRRRRLFDDDADFLPPGPDNLKGRAAIQAFWAAAVEVFEAPRLTTTDVVEITPGCAREIGTYAARLKETGAAVSGKYVIIWRKIDGEWKIWTDIWTSHQGQT